MKKLILVLAVLLIGFAAAAETHVTKGTNFGCVDKEDHSRLTGYLIDGDKDLFESELMSLMYQGKATIFEPGEEVYLEDTAIHSGMVKIRRAGEATEYWTVLEAIDTK